MQTNVTEIYFNSERTRRMMTDRHEYRESKKRNEKCQCQQ